MIVRINGTRPDSGHTEQRYDQVIAVVIGKMSESGPFVEVRPSEVRCLLTTGNLFVRKTCLEEVK